MDNGKKMGGILALFIFAIIGIIFVDILADQVTETEALQNRINQSIVFINNGTNSLASQYVRDNNKVIVSSIFLNNGSPSSLDNANNWTGFVNGSIILTSGFEPGTACFGGASCTLNVTYDFFPQQYVRDQTSRTFLGLVILFFVIAVLLFVIFKVGILSPEMFSLGNRNS